MATATYVLRIYPTARPVSVHVEVMHWMMGCTGNCADDECVGLLSNLSSVGYSTSSDRIMSARTIRIQERGREDVCDVYVLGAVWGQCRS